MAISPHYVGILLAAGKGSRFKAAADHARYAPHKLLAILPNGQSVAQASATSLISTLPTTFAVVFDTPKALPPLLSALGCIILQAPHDNRGMGISLATAARHLLKITPPGMPPPGVVVGLADMPWVKKETIANLLAHADTHRIVVPTYDGQRGHPVVFGSAFIQELAQLDGDSGARTLLLRYGVIQICCDDAGVILDIDTPDDLHKTIAAL